MCARKENCHPKRREGKHKEITKFLHSCLSRKANEVTSGDKTGKGSIRILERSTRWTEGENQEIDIGPRRSVVSIIPKRMKKEQNLVIQQIRCSSLISRYISSVLDKVARIREKKMRQNGKQNEKKDIPIRRRDISKIEIPFLNEEWMCNNLEWKYSRKISISSYRLCEFSNFNFYFFSNRCIHNST